MKRLVLVLIVVFAAACDQTRPADVAEATGVTDGTTETTAPPPPPPPSTEVPDVGGEQVKIARDALGEAGLVVLVTQMYSHEPKGVVLKQTPQAGRQVDEATTVEIVVSQPFPRIPDVTAKNLTQARRILKNAGFSVTVKKQDSTTQREGDIVSQSPSGGTEARSDRLVTLVVINNVCTPGYSPCIPEGPDVDCAGGSGDGPRYVGTVRVTGFDPYGLDDDDDGIGCE